MRALLICSVVAGLLISAPARAQGSPSVAVQAQLAAGEETDALAALRRDEHRLFGDTSTENTVGATFVGELPEALTTDVPASESDAAGGRDLSWFSGMRLPDLPLRWDERVVRYLEYFRDDRRGHRLMSQWLRRSNRYGALIDGALEQADLPRDLRCVAMAESGFDPTVRSHAGAAGMWQFVRRTGEEYGLTQDHWSDMRLDPEASTAAAARYLSQLHRRFGTWELALAAYNMGYGALLSAIRRFNTNDYWTLAHLEAGLPFETTIYVAKILACGVVMRNPDRFGFGELTRDPPMDLVRVSVPGGLAISTLARAAQMPRDELAALNPALLRSRTPPRTQSWPLRVPRERAERFASRLARLSPRHPANRSYSLRFGESLRMVARRFRTTARALRTLNELTDEDELTAGFALLVPNVTPRVDEAPAEPPVVGVPPGDFQYPGRRRVFYRATGHENARSVAAFFHVPVDELLRWNQLDPGANLTSGLMLQLFVAPGFDLSRAVVLSEDSVRVLTVGSEEFFTWQQEQAGRVRFRYTVAPGDTLASIGRRFGLSTGSLARINRFSRRHTLHPGEEILIYAARDHVPARYLPSAPTEETPDQGVAPTEDHDEANGDASASASTDSRDEPTADHSDEAPPAAPDAAE